MQSFKATNQRIFKKKYFGFDIETANHNKEFICASIIGKQKYGKPYIFKSKNKDEIIKELKTNLIFRDSVLFATNLDFDFFGTFFDTDEIGKFHRVVKGSSLLSATTYFLGATAVNGVKGAKPINEFTYDNRFKGTGKSNNRRKSLQFLDTLNYAKMSVAKMGAIIGIPKLPTPSFIKDKTNWIHPRNETEWEEMWAYNIRDSEITYKFMRFLIPAFEELGSTFKMTIASTSMSLYKNQYLEHIGERMIYGNDIDSLQFLFKAFYGGRTETFKRGHFQNAHYYDYNSLYPSIMQQEVFPNPNTQRTSHKDTDRYIKHHEGVSEVEIYIPKMKVQPLPYKTNGMPSLYPMGILKGCYAHNELRNAIKYGAKIIKVHKTIYYLTTMQPFKPFVKTMYKLRQKYQKQKSPMEKVVKLLMNALYGKFGERFDTYCEHIHKDFITMEEMTRAKEQIEDYYICETVEQEPKSHCIPIWSVYVTAYGRIRMHNAMSKADVIYCDTDSMITKDLMPVSEDIGKLKLEQEIQDGYTVRAKFYMTIDPKRKVEIKLKGVPHGILKTKRDFLNLENNPKLIYKKIMKFKEGVRRHIIPNTSVDTSKVLSLEDGKRFWRGQKFTFKELQESDPIEIGKDGKPISNHKVANLKANNKLIMIKGANNKGLVAPTKKYENNNITLPKTPIIDEE